jgi:hypothetical protein
MVGDSDGSLETLGTNDGERLGPFDGKTEGLSDGDMLGSSDGSLEGLSEGVMLKLGPILGVSDGVLKGAPEVSLSMHPQHTSFAVLPFVPA